jgi:glycerophosphoryl diester phosphodiesterase
VLFLGHRGAVSAATPENTLAAVDRALTLGADGVEVDVRLTADGEPVCHHDPGLRRTARDRRLVASLNHRALPRIDGHVIPRLSDVVDLVGDRGRLVVELKTAQWPAGASAAVVDTVARTLARHRLHDVVVSSFDRLRVKQMRQHGLGVRTALLGRPGVPLGVVLRRALQDGHQEAHPHLASVLARLNLVAVTPSIDVVAWTVDRPAELARLAAAGLVAAICDDPIAARRAVSSTPLAPTG